MTEYNRTPEGQIFQLEKRIEKVETESKMIQTALENQIFQLEKRLEKMEIRIKIEQGNFSKYQKRIMIRALNK